MVEVKYFKYCQDVFKFFGLWGKEGKTQTLKTRLSRYTMVGLTSSIILICVTDIIAAFENGDILLGFTKTIMGFSYSLCVQKYAAVAFYNDEIFSCIHQLETMSHKFQNLTDINRSLKTYKWMAAIGGLGINISTLLFLLGPIAARDVPYNPHLPYIDFTKTPYYELMLTFQIPIIVSISNVTLAYDTLFCGLMCLCAGVLASISRETSEISINPYDGKSAENSLRKIIEKLIEISGLIHRLSDIFSSTTMTTILYHCIILATSLFMASSLAITDLIFMTMMAVIIAVSLQLWLYCYFGQRIVNEKEVLQTQLYCTNWYNGSKRFKSMLLLTIFETQNQRYVKAGGILPLSLSTFTEVLKKAYAFYAFMTETR